MIIKTLFTIVVCFFSAACVADSYRALSFDDVVLSHEGIVVAEITSAKSYTFETSGNSEICGYSYTASRIKSIKGDYESLIEFSSIKPLELTKKYLLFISSHNPNQVVAMSPAGKNMPASKRECYISLSEKYVTGSPARAFQFSNKLIDRKEWIVDKEGDAIFPASILEKRVVLRGENSASMFFDEIFRLLAWEDVEREITAILTNTRQPAMNK